MTLANKIQNLRKAKGWTQEELADKMSVSRQALSKWEQGSTYPDALNILQLSKLFEVSADYLLNDDYESEEELPAVQRIIRENDEIINAINKKNKIVFGVLITLIGLSMSGFCFIFAIMTPWNYNGIEGPLGSLLGNGILLPFILGLIILIVGIVVCYQAAYKKKK